MDDSSEIARHTDRFILGSDLAEVWERSITRVINAPDSDFVAGATAGAYLDLAAVTLRALHPSEGRRVSDKYSFPELLQEYAGASGYADQTNADFATIAQRMYGYQVPGHPPLNQIARITDILADDPGTRRALVALWMPEVDLFHEDSHPLGHCFLNFAIRNQALDLHVVSRSVDAWVGAVPNMIAFADVQRRMADGLEMNVGTYTQFILSYHIYLTFLPHVAHVFRSPPNE